MSIHGIDNLTVEQLIAERQRGGRFVRYEFALSIFVMTWRTKSKPHFIPHDRNAVVAGLPYVLLSLIVGWWGFPWGPIYTIGSIFTNLTGGDDVSQEIRRVLDAHLSAASVPNAE